ncbi:MAG: hypothetical protein QXH07_05120 [Thermoplasmata archaeon]
MSKYYNPNNNHFNCVELNVSTNIILWDLGLVSNNTNKFLWSIQALNIHQGTYNVTFQIHVYCILSNRKVESSTYKMSVIESHKISILSESWTYITVQFILSNFYTLFQINGYGEHTNGFQILKSITVREIKPLSKFCQFSIISENMGI